MSDHYICTYCGDDLEQTDAAAPGDELHCDDCGVTYDIHAESDLHDLVIFVCPYCGEPNKRAQGVSTVVCENDEKVDGDCGLEFNPAGAETQPVAEADERPKMVPRSGGGA